MVLSSAWADSPALGRYPAVTGRIGNVDTDLAIVLCDEFLY
jgi:hypothetical protein